MISRSGIAFRTFQPFQHSTNYLIINKITVGIGSESVGMLLENVECAESGRAFQQCWNAKYLIIKFVEWLECLDRKFTS